MANNLELGFHEAMLGIYHDAAALGYRASYFLRMVQERGGVGAARHLLADTEAQSGLTRLWQLNRLDISVEALVLDDRWRTLFNDEERSIAQERLTAYGYYSQNAG